MAVRSKGELLEAVKEIIGDRNDDAVIALLEDIADSYPDEGIDWQKSLTIWTRSGGVNISHGLMNRSIWITVVIMEPPTRTWWPRETTMYQR